MFNKRFVFVSALLTAAMMTGCAENGADIGAASAAPTADVSVSVGEPNRGADASYAGAGAVSDEPMSFTDPKSEDLFAETRTVGLHKLEQIPAGSTYREILSILGSTMAFGHPGYRQYRTFDDRLIQLTFDSKDDICPYSGLELYENAMPLKDELHGNLAIVTGRGGLVTYLTEDNYLKGMILITNDAEITFEDGSPAAEDDLKTGAAVKFETTGEILYSSPEQTVCTKAVILNVRPEPAEAACGETLDDGTVITHYPDGVTVKRFANGGVETTLPYPDCGVVEYTPPAPDPNAQTDAEALFGETVTVTAEQLSAIPAGTSYADILEKLGSTQAFGQRKYRQYITEDDRLIQLWFESRDELCPYSGEELYERAVPLKYDGETPEGMLYGVLGGDGGFFTHYDTYHTDCITGEHLIIRDAEIVFGDGTPASEDDLIPETPALVLSDYVLESYPGQMHCTKIILLK